jgi:hypothetical protein
MKIKLLYFPATFMFILATPGSLLAQSQEQIDKFNAERKVYFTEKLQLTDAEAKAFWPLYEDFQNRKMKLVEDERNTWSYAHKNADHLSEDEILETLEKVYNLKERQLDLEIEYYQGKFLKALPAKKVLQLGKVEWDFRRHLLEKLRENDDDRRGQGGGSGNRPETMDPISHGPSPSYGPSPWHELSPACL